MNPLTWTAVCVVCIGVGCSSSGRTDTTSQGNSVNVSGSVFTNKADVLLEQGVQGPQIVDCGDIELHENAAEGDGLKLEFDPKAFISGGVAAPASGPVKLFVPRSRLAKSTIKASSVNTILAKNIKVDDSKVTIKQGVTGGDISVNGKVVLQVDGTLSGNKVGSVQVSDKQVHDTPEKAQAAAKNGDAVIKTAGIKDGQKKDLYLVAPVKK